MEKFKRISWIAMEVLIYLSIGAALIYLPWILSEEAALYAIAHPGWKGMGGWILLLGYIMAIFAIGITYDHCTGTAYYLTLISFLVAPWIEFLTAYRFRIGDTDEAFKLIFLSLLVAFVARISIAAFDKDRMYLSPYWNFPSNFNKRAWQK
ncbi:MAG: hypothetical protein NT170_01635 [Candidatus Moranbacteria bacterium]|nr:hypothetical protein [Candidatus Moranbacteria bacterium]